MASEQRSGVLSPAQRRVIDYMRENHGKIAPGTWRTAQAAIGTTGPGLKRSVNLLVDQGVLCWVPGWRGRWVEFPEETCS